MNRVIGLKRGNSDRVGFKSLVDLFNLENDKSPTIDVRQLDIPAIEHHVETQITKDAELCRRILMAGCQSQRSALRDRIVGEDPAILALYRGFSRFMLEDLERHPFTQGMSRSKQKKLSAKVAFEMIMVSPCSLLRLCYPKLYKQANRLITNIPIAEPSLFESCGTSLSQPHSAVDPCVRFSNLPRQCRAELTRHAP